ncbi:MAG: beta/gamma crystallin-related protein, partial [Hydrogenophaga sp.]|nr:beta/gamma crystallin-related protein [Hydrogenophaga sp.]
MNARIAPFHLALAVMTMASMTFATQAVAQASFYEKEAYTGRSLSATEQIRNLQRQGFKQAATSVVVAKGKRWEVCDEERFRGNCMVLRPGRYPSPAAMGLNDRVASARALPNDERIADNRYAPEPVPAQLTFYARENFRGKTYSTETNVPNLQRTGFNDRAESAVVLGERWEVCDNAQFRGRCVVLRPGRYPSLDAMGLNGQISSLREVAWDAQVAKNR